MKKILDGSKKMRDLRRYYTEVELDGLFDRNPNVNEDLSDLEVEFEDEYRMVMDALRKKYKNKYKELLGDFLYKGEFELGCKYVADAYGCL